MNVKLDETEYMPAGGVKELLQSRSGRKYLQKLRERHKHDIVQPKDNPELFEKVWGRKVRRDKTNQERNESVARQMWADNEERKRFNPKKKKIYSYTR